MEAFYFGPVSKKLFGVLHRPTGSRALRAVVVLCYPYGAEYVNAHRFYVLWSITLAEAGFACLRFDYSATGDSFGETSTSSVATWLEDVDRALEQARHHTHCELAILAGVRLGASLAAITAARRSDVDGLALWAPVVDGADYWKQLVLEHRAWLRGSFAKQRAHHSREIMGLAVSEQLEEEVQGVQLTELKRAPTRDVLLIEDARGPDAGLEEHLRKLGVRLEREVSGQADIWLKQADRVEEGVTALRTIRRSVQWMRRLTE